MKSLLLNQGQRILLDTHEPICLSHEVKVKVFYSSVSFGTEGNTSNSQKFNTIIKSREKWIKAKKLILDDKKPLKAIKKFKNLKKVYECIGYSAVGEVLEIGRCVQKDIRVGDLVHVGGEFASHQEIVSVPQNFCFPLNHISNENLFLYSLPTIMSVPYHGIMHALDALITRAQTSSKALIVGGGVIGTMAGLILKEMSLEVKFKDIQENTLSDFFFDRVCPQDRLDLIVICSPTMAGIENYLQQSNEGVVVSVIGETPLSAPRDLLEDKYATIRFCKSFGYGRGNKAFEFGAKDLKDSPFPYSFTKNINDCIQLITPLSTKLVEVVNRTSIKDIQIQSNKINILDWEVL